MTETRSLSLRDYVQHTNECHRWIHTGYGMVFNTDMSDTDHQCTCGLDAVLRSQEPVQAQWQPIETAPKDRLILGYEPAGALGSGVQFSESVGIIYWWAGDVRNKPGWNAGTGIASGPRCFPTHWMPLPSAPVG